MAERNRRGDDAADDRPEDESFDDEAIADDDATDDDEPVARGGTATRSKPKSEAADGRPKAKADARVGFFGRIIRFIREVVAELRKVIWPTRKELLTYTAVVVVFIAVMLTIVAGLDFVFAKGVLWVFGNPS
ncbi:preprotein translocase subunit SecE [Solwaraspora sp. WMMD406]|uniref:preprotein translocase subunit SecE n=1 Tax=Solwaraspora sp. WMMD406 TaxID=3016095 RepID=UPI002415E096|nr:preprotein translocase subunit SecE [Solwaraspora sp. WMMD406]MDG4763648.1 preprotein translocase subunit SecE [Solwaraspora sp. WMMD406]